MDFQQELQALLSFHGLLSLFILSVLELVLGVDNIIFISLLLTKIPEERRFSARIIALSLAFVMRIIMLFGIVWLSQISNALFAVSNFEVSIKDILFFIGGAYLIYNTIKELIVHVNNKEGLNTAIKAEQSSHKSIIFQIVLIDILFSFDSIFTAIGIIPNFIIMALAVGIGMVCMIYLSARTSKFIEKHPVVKTLALSFIIAVGLLLILQAFHLDIPKEYFYSCSVAGLGAGWLFMRNKNRQKT